jgi:hypothetical protein
MTEEHRRHAEPDAGPPVCTVLPPDLVAAYAAGALAGAEAWSVEAHVPGCRDCRTELASRADAARLQRNRDVVMARLGLPEPGPAGRALRRCGVPEHITALLAATPSLRRSWLAGVLLVLAIAAGASQLFAVGHYGLAPQPALAVRGGWAPLVPYLVVAPLLPLVAVAAAFSPVVDPASRLASAAPVSMVWLLCVRSAAVIAATLVPVALAALALPGPAWLAAALLLPALAVCAAALGLATAIGPVAATIVAGVGWATLVIGITVIAGQPAAVFGPAGQLAAAAVLTAGAALIALRRRKIDYGWLG